MTCFMVDVLFIIVLWLGFGIFVNLVCGIVRIRLFKDNYRRFYLDGEQKFPNSAIVGGRGWNVTTLTLAHIFWPIYIINVIGRIIFKIIDPIGPQLVKFYKAIFASSEINLDNQSELKQLREEVKKLKKEKE